MGDEVSKSMELSPEVMPPTAQKATELVLPIGKASAGKSSLSPSVGDFTAERTLIIFDWDDTLLCSSALRLSQPSEENLRQLERAVEAFLLTAMSLGETIIVTNGTESWVRDSASRFVPGLLPLLDSITSISARARHEHKYPDDPFAWKREAFQQLMTAYPEGDATPEHPAAQFAPRVRMNVVIIGDSWYEIEAARCTFGASPTWAVKTVKFKDTPTVQELLGQIRRSSKELSRFVAAGHNERFGLTAKPLPGHLEVLVACCSSWEVTSDSPSPSDASTVSPPPSPLLPAPTPTDMSTSKPLPLNDIGDMEGPKMSDFDAASPAPPGLSTPALPDLTDGHHLTVVEQHRCGKVY